MAAIVGAFGSSSSFLEGSPSQWVDQLLPSVIEDGVGTFLLATDDRPTLERFAAEVIPGLRLAVDHERRRTGSNSAALIPTQAFHPLEGSILPTERRHIMSTIRILGHGNYASRHRHMSSRRWQRRRRLCP